MSYTSETLGLPGLRLAVVVNMHKSWLTSLKTIGDGFQDRAAELQERQQQFHGEQTKRFEAIISSIEST